MAEKKDNETRENLFAKTVSILQTVTDDNLAEMYARYENQLKEEADCGDDEEEYAFLLEINEILRGVIVQKYMKEHNWHENSQDYWKRWERD